MDDIHAWFAAHAQATLFIGLACLLVGLSLVVINLLLRSSIRRHTISARSGGVVVGRDNPGTIITGGIRDDKTPERSDLLVAVASWVTIIIGPLLALIGIILTFLAWQFPVHP